MTLHLSLLTLNLRDRQARIDAGNGYELHRTLHRAFPDATAGGAGAVRFRVDSVEGERAAVLVQSEKLPDWSCLPSGYLATAAAAKPFDPPLLVRAGDVLLVLPER